MSIIQSLEDLEDFKQEILTENKRRAEQGFIDVIVSMGSCGIAAGACDTLEAMKEQIKQKKLKKIRLSETGCIGLCKDEPLVEIHTSDGHKTVYGHVSPEAARRIIDEHVQAGKIVQDLLIKF